MYAGFWKRTAALIVDTIITWLGALVIAFMVGALFVPADADDLTTSIITALVNIVPVWLYFALMESSAKQATFGKQMLGIRVTDTQGKPISFARATGRHFGKILSWVLLCIGYLMVAFTQKKQGLHDIMASCLVVNNEVPEQTPAA